ncbi:MAG: hypothetical protein WCH99_10100 [Verrucomicrobiota bacterium]
MSTKKRLSKLDQYSRQLVEMEAGGSTLAQMQAWLKEEGCTVALSNLSTFLSSQRQSRLQSSLLQQIASGAQQCREVEAQFGSNPAPELDTLIKLHRVLILNLTTQGNADPELLKLADQLTRTALEFVSGKTKAAFKERELTLAEEKFQFDAATACLAKLPELKAVSDAPKLSEEQKRLAIQQILFPKS